MKSSNKVRLKKSNVERVTNSLIILVFLFELFLCAICAIGNGLWLTNQKDTAVYLSLESETPASAASLSFLTFLILFSNLIPISLYVSMETVKFGQSKLIDSDIAMYYPEKDIACISRTSSLNEELGQVEYIFSDKTGTLTRNLMEFKNMTIAGRPYGANTTGLPTPPSPVIPPEYVQNAGRAVTNSGDLNTVPFLRAAAAPAGSPESSLPHFCFEDENDRVARDLTTEAHSAMINEFYTLLAVCHTVIPEPDPDSPGQLIYQAASPDEGALVNAAAAFGYRFHSRTPSSVTIAAYGVDATFQILHVNAFNSTRKRMSVLVRTPPEMGSRILVLCKGADTMLYELLDPEDPINAATGDITLSHLDAYAKQGLRTLVCASRAVPEDEYEAWMARVREAKNMVEGKKDAMAALAAEIETNLVLLGATAIEDKLQDDVPQTIADLRAAGIKIWVLTGDKQETAIMIGKSCRLLSDGMRVLIPNSGADDAEHGEASSSTGGARDIRADLEAKLTEYLEEIERSDSPSVVPGAESGAGLEFACVVDGSTLELLLGRPDQDDSVLDETTHRLRALLLAVSTKCKSVIGCRVSPAQKAQVVKFVQDALHPVTLSIGDGANDVDMIKEAHIGIGINGEEGGQAALSADYAIGQFKYLKPLLLVHGHWCYHRISKLIFYSFYKNIALALVPFWFVFANGYSGQTFVEKWTFSLYNVIYTALPILMVGLYDQCLTRDRLETLPQLYRSGPANRFFNLRSFAGWLASAVYHSLVFYYVGEACVGSGGVFANGQSAGLYFNGLVIMSCIVVTVTLKLMLETNTFTVVTWLAIVLNAGGYFVFILAYSFFGVVYPDAWDMYFVGPRMFMAARFWLAVTLVPVICLVPDLCWVFVRRTWFPEPYVIVQERDALNLDADGRAGVEDAPLLMGYESVPVYTEAGRFQGESERDGVVRRRKERASTFAYDHAPEEHVDLIMGGGGPTAGGSAAGGSSAAGVGGGAGSVNRDDDDDDDAEFVEEVRRV